jgi:hypothetical protein
MPPLLPARSPIGRPGPRRNKRVRSPSISSEDEVESLSISSEDEVKSLSISSRDKVESLSLVPAKKNKKNKDKVTASKVTASKVVTSAPVSSSSLVSTIPIIMNKANMMKISAKVKSAQRVPVPSCCLRCSKQLLDVAVICQKPTPYSKCIRCAGLGSSCDDVPAVFHAEVNKLVAASLLGANPEDSSHADFKSDVERYVKSVTAYQRKQKKAATAVPSAGSEEPLSGIDLELLRAAWSINRNLFRLVNLGREATGLNVLDEDEEEVHLE